MKLDNGELEDVLAGNIEEPTEMEGETRKRLGDARALKKRLQEAFASAEVDRGLSERISEQLAGARTSQRRWRSAAHIVVGWRVRTWAAVAAALLIAVPLLVYLVQGPSLAHADHVQLVDIHEHNLVGVDGFREAHDEKLVEAFLVGALGVDPAMPAGEDIEFEGYCTDELDGDRVVGYMIEIRGLHVSIVIAEADEIDSDLGNRLQVSGETCFTCTHDDCNLMSVEIGEFTYFVIGQVPREVLTEVLQRLLADQQG